MVLFGIPSIHVDFCMSCLCALSGVSILVTGRQNAHQKCSKGCQPDEFSCWSILVKSYCWKKSGHCLGARRRSAINLMTKHCLGNDKSSYSECPCTQQHQHVRLRIMEPPPAWSRKSSWKLSPGSHQAPSCPSTGKRWENDLPPKHTMFLVRPSQMPSHPCPLQA